jgi:hypothetical protein
MTPNKSQQDQVQNLLPHVENLNETLDELLGVMNAQKKALVASEIEKVEHLTEVHSQLSVRFNEQEENFVNAIQKLINDKKIQDIRMSGLKKEFPDAAEIIDLWRNTLLEKTNLLQNKHQHIIHLLEFVMNRNASMMKTIYSLHNKKNTQYGISGNKESIVSGVAVNQKV